ncbi:MAG: sulfite exporter TauE/SafE family protein [Dehalococcoidia bacterium]
MLPDLTVAQALTLAALGVSIGALGATVGVGGGFLLVPALLLMFPEAEPSAITSMSLTAVFLNSASASVGFRIRRRQDLRTAAILISLGLPLAVLGALANRVTERQLFELIFGLALVSGAVYLAWRGAGTVSAILPSTRGRERRIVDRGGRVYEYRVNETATAAVAPGAGLIAGFFGIGGGIINVPMMILLLRIPSVLAVATSQLALTTSAGAALSVHLIFSFDQSDQWIRAAIVGGGALIGGQIGVRLASQVGGRFVLLAISAALMLVGVRQIFAALT